MPKPSQLGSELCLACLGHVGGVVVARDEGGTTVYRAAPGLTLRTREGKTPVESLLKDLAKLAPLAPLEARDGLARAADRHARVAAASETYTGSRRRRGHDVVDRFFEKPQYLRLY